ncbi:MAG TPA: glutathione S-transferase family protein [Nevskiaceae bacterium]|nr:glutathione S-transferase family protein [Nevskiaceae bacterium]
MYRLHIANKNYSSWSLRPWALMRVQGLAFEEVLHPFAPGSNRAAFRAFSPTGKVPCLIDGQTAVWDSLAIVEYLAERHPGVWPPDPAARAWARSASAEMHSGFAPLRNHCGMNCGLRVALHERPAALEQDLERLAELWGEGLARWGGPWLTGRAFSAVDAFYAPVAFRVQTYALPLPAVAQAYVERLLALPAMREWYQAALDEPYRDPDHEAEVLAVGRVLADHRRTAA